MKTTIDVDFQDLTPRLHETRGERRLLSAIVLQALLDFVSAEPKSDEWKEAGRFIFDDSTGKGSFRWAVEGAGIGSVELFRSFILSPLPREEKIRRLHRADPQVIKNRGKRK